MKGEIGPHGRREGHMGGEIGPYERRDRATWKERGSHGKER